MSPDENFVFILALCAGLVLWYRWGWVCGRVARFGARPRSRVLLWVAPLVCLSLLLLVLRTASAEDVRYDPVYLVFYAVLGIAWVGVAKIVLAPLGLSARDDVIERGNGAAAWAIAGALVGLTLCFAGANIGNGPGWWVVVFSGALATGCFLLAWVVLARMTGWADRITIDRDGAAGVRAAGFFIGAGLILGRAVAGDWQSASVTLLDFCRLSWPIFLLAATALVVEKMLPPAGPPLRVGAVRGWLPGTAYVVLAGALVALMGCWS